MQTKQRGLTREFGRFLVSLSYEDLPAEVIEMAKSRMLDALSVSYNGKNLPHCQVALRSIGGSKGVCTILGEKTKAAAADTAFVNAVIGHSTLQEDFGGGGHPGTYIIPVALAVGEERGTSGTDIIIAVVTGYEAAARMTQAVPPEMTERGFRAVPALGVFGAAATAGKVMGLNEEQMAAALDLAANMACGIYQGFAEGTMEGYFHAGFSARNGILAAYLAEAGADTSLLTLDGPHGFFKTFGGAQGNPEVLLGGARNGFGIMHVLCKPFPACALNQETMLLAASLGRKSISASDIEKLVIRRPFAGLNSFNAPGVLSDPPYTNMLQAQMAAKFTVVASLLGRPVEDVGYYRDSYGDPEVAEVARRTELVAEARQGGAVEVYLKNGEKAESREDVTVELKPDTWMMRQKFQNLAPAILGSRTKEVLETITNLDRVHNIRDLTVLL
ncbi:MAG TPA: MmgE/PrpD family protein [Candidatus Binatia bacterium]|jgi:2-methylcitrate dehydratase PrpD|nr:MmgE/PrpD family protein [Candidatus Binatia bacterium]